MLKSYANKERERERKCFQLRLLFCWWGIITGFLEATWVHECVTVKKIKCEVNYFFLPEHHSFKSSRQVASIDRWLGRIYYDMQLLFYCVKDNDLMSVVYEWSSDVFIVHYYRHTSVNCGLLWMTHFCEEVVKKRILSKEKIVKYKCVSVPVLFPSVR